MNNYHAYLTDILDQYDLSPVLQYAMEFGVDDVRNLVDAIYFSYPGIVPDIYYFSDSEIIRYVQDNYYIKVDYNDNFGFGKTRKIFVKKGA